MGRVAIPRMKRLLGRRRGDLGKRPMITNRADPLWIASLGEARVDESFYVLGPFRSGGKRIVVSLYCSKSAYHKQTLLNLLTFLPVSLIALTTTKVIYTPKVWGKTKGIVIFDASSAKKIKERQVYEHGWPLVVAWEETYFRPAFQPKNGILILKSRLEFLDRAIDARKEAKFPKPRKATERRFNEAIRKLDQNLFQMGKTLERYTHSCTACAELFFRISEDGALDKVDNLIRQYLLLSQHTDELRRVWEQRLPLWKELEEIIKARYDIDLSLDMAKLRVRLLKSMLMDALSSAATGLRIPVGTTATLGLEAMKFLYSITMGERRIQHNISKLENQANLFKAHARRLQDITLRPEFRIG